MHISFTLYLHQEKNIKDINKNMKSLEVKAAEYVYASIADGYFSKEMKNGKEIYEGDRILINRNHYVVIFYKGMFAIEVEGCGYIPLRNV